MKDYEVTINFGGFIGCDNTYTVSAESEEEAREEAIDWQNYASGRDMSYGELIVWQEHFEKVGKRFGLLGEFRENCIC